MASFADLNIKLPESKIFDAKQVGIDEVLNENIEVLDFQLDVKTKYGDGRSIVLAMKGKNKVKFFTDSKRIKYQLEQVDKSQLPFTSKVTVHRFSERMKSYQFV